MPSLLSRQSSSKSSSSSKTPKPSDSPKSSSSSKSSRSSSSRHSPTESRSSSRTSGYSYASQSSGPASVSSSPRPSQVNSSSKSGSGGAKVVIQQPREKHQEQQRHQHRQQEKEEKQKKSPQQQQEPQERHHEPMRQHSYNSYNEDLSPGTSLCPRSSAETYASTNPSQEELFIHDGGDDDEDDEDGGASMGYEYYHQEIPPLPTYHREIVEPNVRPTNPQEFAKLFPSMNRFSIRHDEFTPDGNMNLRVDTVVNQPASRHGRSRRTVMQLFHLRMYDLSRREFSLRRYCRDSGRELCNSKRKYSKPPPVVVGGGASSASPKSKSKSSSSTSSSSTSSSTTKDSSRPSLQRSMTSAIKTLSSRPQSKRSESSTSTNSSSSSSKGSTIKGSYFSANKGADGHHGSKSGKKDKEKEKKDKHKAATTSAHPQPVSISPPASAVATPTNTIKLEFSNYARVDLERRGKTSSDSKRYDFEWWGRKYSWKRATEKHTGAVSFHLIRRDPCDKKEAKQPVAHIVPETRSRVQVEADEEAGGWIPPCHMWIDDKTVLEAMTDIADVIMATGLVALVDDCIKERWETRKIHRIPVPLTSRTVDVEYVSPKTFMQHVFGRLNSSEKHQQQQRQQRHGHHQHDDHLHNTPNHYHPHYEDGYYYYEAPNPIPSRHPISAY